jgi:hypothetical protein
MAKQWLAVHRGSQIELIESEERPPRGEGPLQAAVYRAPYPLPADAEHKALRATW